MTDEEMADKYIKDNCERWECDCLSVDDIAKENFLAGLKAGRQPIKEAVEIIRELGGIVREGVTCHYLTDCGAILYRATLFIKEATK